MMPIIIIVEITGGILFNPNKIMGLGAIIVFPIVIGILLTHILNALSGLQIAIVLLAINLWVIRENREKYLPIVK